MNETADLQTLTVETRPSLQPTPTRTRSPYILDVFTPQAQEVKGLQVELSPNEDYTDALLHITRNGSEDYELSVFSIIGDFSAIGGVRLLSIRDLDLDGEAEIVLNIFLHGASCCTVIAAIYFDKAATQYKSTNLIYKNWGNSPRLVDIGQDNRPVFITRVGSSIFGTALNAVTPIEIYGYSNGEIKDVTQEFPELVEQDAIFWLAVARKELVPLDDEYTELMGMDLQGWIELERIEQPALTAYLVNMYRLDRGEEGLNTVMELCDNEECKQFFERLSGSMANYP